MPRPYSPATYAAMTEAQLVAVFRTERDMALEGERLGLSRMARNASVRAMLAAHAAVNISDAHCALYDEACDLLAEYGMDEQAASAHAAERDARHTRGITPAI